MKQDQPQKFKFCKSLKITRNELSIEYEKIKKF